MADNRYNEESAGSAFGAGLGAGLGGGWRSAYDAASGVLGQAVAPAKGALNFLGDAIPAAYYSATDPEGVAAEKKAREDELKAQKAAFDRSAAIRKGNMVRNARRTANTDFSNPEFDPKNPYKDYNNASLFGALGESEASQDIEDKYHKMINSKDLNLAFQEQTLNEASNAANKQFSWVREMKAKGVSKSQMISEIQGRNLSPEDNLVAMGEVEAAYGADQPKKPYEVENPELDQIKHNSRNRAEGKGDGTGYVAVDSTSQDVSEDGIRWNASQDLGSKVATNLQTHEYWYQDDDFVNDGLMRMGLGILLGEDIGDAWNAASAGYQNSVNRKRRSAFAQELIDMGYDNSAVSDYIQSGELDQKRRTIKMETGTDSYGNIYERNPYTGETKIVEKPTTYGAVQFDKDGFLSHQYDSTGKYIDLSDVGIANKMRNASLKSSGDKSIWTRVEGTATSKPYYINQYGDVKADPAYLKPEEGPRDFGVTNPMNQHSAYRIGTPAKSQEANKAIARLGASEFNSRGLVGSIKTYRQALDKAEKEGGWFSSRESQEVLLNRLLKADPGSINSYINAHIKTSNPELAEYISSSMRTLMPLIRDDSGATITETEMLREFMAAGITPTDTDAMVKDKLSGLANTLLTRFAGASDLTPLGRASAMLLEELQAGNVLDVSIGNDGIWYKDGYDGKWKSMKKEFGITRAKASPELRAAQAATQEQSSRRNKQE